MHQLDPKNTLCFLTAVQTGTIRAAAMQIGLEPSTVSRNISALETSVAATLIERGRSGVRPTQAGRLMLAYLNQQAGALELLRSEFDALANMQRGTVSIAVGEGFVGDLFDSALARFSTRFPDITFTISVGSTEHVVQQISSEQAHVGMAYNVAADPKIRIDKSAAQPLVALVRRSGKYDHSPPIDLETLATIPCTVPPKTFGIGAIITAIEAKHGLRLNALVETGSIAALKSFVRNDMGCTILPKFVVEHEVSSGLMSAHPLPSKVFSGGVSALIRKEGRKLPQAAEFLLRQLRKMSAFN
ncbi:MAG: LysR family transcriptional regulator [Sulfitobacter sp.]